MRMKRWEFNWKKLRLQDYICGGLFLLCVLVLLIAGGIKKRLDDAIIIETFPCDRYFLPMEFVPEQEESGELSLDYIREGTPVKEVEYNTEYPAYQSNGATLYLYEANYNMVFTDFVEQVGRKEAIAGDGTVFSEYTMEAIGKNVMLLKLTGKDVYINLMPVQLEGRLEAELLPNSILRFEENRIQVFEYYRGRMRQRIIILAADTYVRVGETRYTYYEWRQALERPDKSLGIEKPQTRQEGFFYFDLEQKYTLEGDCIVRRTENNRIMLENDDVLHDVDSIPLYYLEEDAVLLPGRYALVQPLIYRMNSLPEFTKLKLFEGMVYLDKGETEHAIKNAVVYDGDGHFILTEAGVLTVGKRTIALSPLSMVIVEDEQRLSVFDYESKEFQSFYTQGMSVRVSITNNVSLLPMEYAVQRFDKESEILTRIPSILPLYE